MNNIKYWLLFKLYCICDDYVRWVHNLEDVDPEYTNWLDDAIAKDSRGK